MKLGCKKIWLALALATCLSDPAQAISETYYSDSAEKFERLVRIDDGFFVKNQTIMLADHIYYHLENGEITESDVLDKLFNYRIYQYNPMVARYSNIPSKIFDHGFYYFDLDFQADGSRELAVFMTASQSQSALIAIARWNPVTSQYETDQIVRYPELQSLESMILHSTYRFTLNERGMYRIHFYSDNKRQYMGLGLSTPEAYLIADYKSTLIMLFCVGITGFFAIYNLFSFFTHRNKIYLIFSTYILTAIATNAFIHKWGHFIFYHAIWPIEKNEMSYYTNPLSLLTTAFLFWFIAEFTEIKEDNKRLYKILVGMFVFFVVCSPFQLFLVRHDLSYVLLTRVIILFGIMFCISYSLVCSIKYRKPLYFLLFISYLPFVILVFSYLLFLQGKVTWTSYVENYPLIGLMIQSVLLSFSIGLKSETAQRSLNKKIFHAYEQLRKVFYPHQIKQIEQGLELENTMPTIPGEACVICLDIIGSSRIQHINAKDFFLRFFHACDLIMAENYDGENLVSNAYRIKSMGDGFLCSVGYPFTSTYESPAVAAVELALRFHEVFQKEVKSLDYPDPLHCSIGIAADNINGFYPESGAKEYDLFGRSIVLATRYENMRNVILRDQAMDSILILQERVYKSLDSNSRTAFQAYDVAENGVMVRDDTAATRLYYRMLSDSKEDFLQIPFMPCIEPKVS